MNSEFNMWSEVKPYLMMISGGASIATLNVVFGFIGACGVIWGGYMAHKRFQEQKRANDLSAERLAWEKQLNAENSNTPQTTAVRRQDSSKEAER